MATTTDPGEKLGAIAAAIAALFGGIDELIQVLDWEPIGVPQDLPCVHVAEATGRGTGIDAHGHELGKDDYWQTWVVRSYHELSARPELVNARSIFGRMLAAVNQDFRLDGEVRELVIEGFNLRPNGPAEKKRMHVGEIRLALLYTLTIPE